MCVHVIVYACVNWEAKLTKGPSYGQMRLAEAGIMFRMADVQLVYLASLATLYQV